MGDSQYSLAGALVTLIHQLEAAFHDREWQTSPGTGTIGDAAHRAQGSASDHNPWLHDTVRALDVAKTAKGPDCEQLFRMVNKMYGDHDPRVYPYGYAIFNGRITDWDNPGGYHAQQGDPHTEHCHISVGQTGYDRTDPWPIHGPQPADPMEEIMAFYKDRAEFEAAVRGIVYDELHKGVVVSGMQAWDDNDGKPGRDVHNPETLFMGIPGYETTTAREGKKK